MRFYNLEYILSHQSFDLRLRAAFIIFFLILAVAFSSVYVRNRIKTRWRDVGIGMLVLTLILLGVQVENYSQVSLRSSQSQMLVKFIEGVATDQGVSTDEVLAFPVPRAFNSFPWARKVRTWARPRALAGLANSRRIAKPACGSRPLTNWKQALTDTQPLQK